MHSKIVPLLRQPVWERAQSKKNEGQYLAEGPFFNLNTFMIVSPLIFVLVTCLLGFVVGIILPEIVYSFYKKEKTKGRQRRSSDKEVAKKWWYTPVVNFLRLEPKYLASRTCLAFGIITLLVLFLLTISVDTSSLLLKELTLLLAPWPPTLIALAIYFKIKK